MIPAETINVTVHHAAMQGASEVIFLIMMASFGLGILATVPLVIGMISDRDRLVNWSGGFMFGLFVISVLSLVAGMTGEFLGWWA